LEDVLKGECGDKYVFFFSNGKKERKKGWPLRAVVKSKFRVRKKQTEYTRRTAKKDKIL